MEEEYFRDEITTEEEYYMETRRIAEGSRLYFPGLMNNYLQLLPYFAAEHPVEANIIGSGISFPAVNSIIFAPILDLISKIGEPIDPIIGGMWDAFYEADSEYTHYLTESLYNTGIKEFRTKGFIDGMTLLADVWAPNNPIPSDIPKYEIHIERFEYKPFSDTDKIGYVIYDTDVLWIELLLGCLIKRAYVMFGEPVMGLYDNLLDLYRSVFQRFFDLYGEGIIDENNASDLSKTIIKVVLPNNATVHKTFLLRFQDFAPQLRDEDFIQGVNKLHDLQIEKAEKITLD